MAKGSKPSGGGSRVGKTVVIGVLSVLLLLVIVAQFGGKKKHVTRQPTEQRKSSRRSEPTTQPMAPVNAAKRSEKPWPTFDVAEAVANNPFMLPEALRPQREATKTLTPSTEPGEVEADVAAIESARVREMRRRQAEFVTSLRAQGFDMILSSPRGSIARIGDLSLRVGDVHEGLRVEEIGEYGVVLKSTGVDGKSE